MNVRAMVLGVATRTRILLAFGALALLCVAGWSIVPKTTAVICTNAQGLARTWTTSVGGVQFGGAGSASGSARGPAEIGPADKSSYRHASLSPAQALAQRQQLYVGDAISRGVDPITAARQFGPWTVPSAEGAQLAHAIDPATYGWQCP